MTSSKQQAYIPEVHYPRDSTFKESKWRKALCHGNRFVVDIKHKGTPQDPAESHSYYSHDKEQITCKMCLRKLNNSGRKNNPLNVRAKLRRLYERKSHLEAQILKLESLLDDPQSSLA